MPLTQKEQKKKHYTRLLITLPIAAAIVLATVYWLNSSTQSGLNENSRLLDGKTKINQADIAKDLARAADAALLASPVSGTLSERPDFVSEFEWQVLKSAADQRSNDSGRELTSLVNKLLFAKKREAWIASTGDPATRRELARQMLEMIPSQVDTMALEPAAAKEMESILRKDLAGTAN